MPITPSLEMNRWQKFTEITEEGRFENTKWFFWNTIQNKDLDGEWVG